MNLLKPKYYLYIILMIFFFTILQFGIVNQEGRGLIIQSEALNDKVYFLPLIFYKFSPFCDREPNGRVSIAIGPLNSGADVKGCFEFENDTEDNYFIYLYTPSVITVTLTNISEGQNYDIYLKNSVGTVLKGSNQTGNVDEEFTTDTLPAQLYYIVIDNKDRGVSFDQYILKVIFEDKTVQCDNLGLKPHVYGQFTNEALARPFYGPVNKITNINDDPNFHCRGVSLPVQSEQLSYFVDYKSVGENFGFFGLRFDGPPYYDLKARKFSQFCVQYYTKGPTQSFFMNIKSRTSDIEFEGRIDRTTSIVGDWDERCIPLIDYENLGVNLSSIDNFNIGVNKESQDAIIWFDTIGFK